uniref:NB-ARC domain-containing protein n=1 Tax=Kalanchoe fedtschenkoi TaxID=63787 RepID=A0A7N1A6Z5_KALFE
MVGENALDWRRRNVEEEDVIGFDQQTCEVMKMLMPKGGGVEDNQLRVVSVVGMGGLGKSTLAKKIFNHHEIKTQFGTRVWVVVSEHVEAKHVLKNILQYLNVKFDKEDDDYLKGLLKEQLNGRKYLIVLDDLWTSKQWNDLKLYLPTDQKRCSRILLTSRTENVANVASTDTTTYHLNPLGEADSWSLFCKKALKGEKCPPNLEATGKGIVSKCKGLPLAIIVLGSFLSEAEPKPSFKYWSKILGDTSWHPDSDNDCSKILLLSYRNLQPHLRMCFLYVGAFQEDFEIQAKDLCLLWVAEGFVKVRRTELEEDVAEDYLIKLADRNLIMISKRKSDGSIKSCRIHDLLRDLCIKEAEKCNFFEVNVDRASQNVKEGVRRLTITNSDDTALLRLPLYKGLRTLLDFFNNASKLRSACDHLSVIRVLHLHVDTEKEDRAPIRLKNLILLKYLKADFIWAELSHDNMIQYISKLSNLQVLNLKRYGMANLPKGIWKLKLLRHVYVRPLATMPDARSSHDSLPYLQTLSCIKYEKHTSKMLCTKRFPNLRKLSVYHLCANQLWAVNLQSLSKLVHLSALKIRFKLEYYYPLPRIFVGSLNVDALPSTLTKINLNNMALTSNHWRLLGELKNLQVLKVSIRRIGNHMELGRFMEQPLVFEAEAFPQLIRLKLKTAHPALILRNGALRTLQYFIIHCGWIENFGMSAVLSEQLWLLTTLRQVKLINATRGIRHYIQNLDDAKRSKVIFRHS